MSEIRDVSDVDDFRRSHRFGALVQPHVGLVSTVRPLALRLGELEVEVFGGALGAVAKAFDHVVSDEPLSGAGNDPDFERAWVKAVVESAERYAAVVHSERDFVVASAAELGAAAMDLEVLPRCSEREYSDPRCPLRPPSPDRPIRWVRGYSLIDRVERLVPAVMAHLGMRAWESERFWLQISTGVAAHTSVQAALVGAICEVVERDALALTWLGRLSLPRFEVSESPPEKLRRLLAGAERSAVDVHVFDATTDVGIPTALSVQLWDGHPFCDVSVSCATATEPERAFEKALCEAVSARVAMDKAHEIPDAVVDFSRLTHGAHYFGRGGQRRHLDFLLEQNGTGPLPALGGGLPRPMRSTDAERLELLLQRLGHRGLDVIAVDLSTDELRDVGLWAVRVLIPALMPISFVQRARFLGSRRLHDFVTTRTGVQFAERDVNRAPLPFA